MEKQDDFMRLFKPCYKQLWNYILMKVNDREEAKDILSESILIAYEKFDSLQNKDSFTGYIFTISKRLIYGYWNDKKENQRDFNVDIDMLYGNELDAEDRADLKEFYNSLEKLPKEQAEVLVLYEIHGLTRKEISEILDTNVLNIKQKLYRARKNIKKILGIENDK